MVHSSYYNVCVYLCTFVQATRDKNNNSEENENFRLRHMIQIASTEMGAISNAKYISGVRTPHITDINLAKATVNPEKAFTNRR